MMHIRNLPKLGILSARYNRTKEALRMLEADTVAIEVAVIDVSGKRVVLQATPGLREKVASDLRADLANTEDEITAMGVALE